MMARRIALLAALLCSAALLAACGSAKHEWSQADSSNTIAAYQTFLSKYPNDVHAPDAKSRIAQMQDEQAWSTAQAASTLQGYQQYLTAKPSVAHAQAAREEITSRERSAAWQILQANETVQSLQNFLQQYPTGPEADRARVQLKTFAGYRAELAIAHSRRLADRERDALAKRFRKSFQQVVVLEPNAASHYYRIASSPMSEQNANAGCVSVKHIGRSCQVIQTAG
jgi:outer membrane protein assembly factor BamD (BamD/ComL family)